MTKRVETEALPACRAVPGRALLGRVPLDRVERAKAELPAKRVLLPINRRTLNAAGLHAKAL